MAARCRRSRATRGLRAARQRHPFRRPVVQISPSARHPRPRVGGAERAGRRRSRPQPARSQQPRHRSRGVRWPEPRQPEPLAIAALRCRRDQRCARRRVRVRVLLQDLHVAAGVLEACLRAGDPSGGRSRQGADGSRSRPLHAAPCPCRGAGGRRRAGRRRGGTGRIGRRPAAGHHLRRAGRMRRLVAARPDVDGGRHAGAGVARRGDGDAPCPRQRDDPDPHHGIRLLQSQSYRAGRADHRSPAATGREAAARADVAGAGRPGDPGDRSPSSGRWCSPTTIGRASCWPRACASMSTAMPCCPAGRR